jgi:hypothetical protein
METFGLMSGNAADVRPPPRSGFESQNLWDGTGEAISNRGKSAIATAKARRREDPLRMFLRVLAP